MVNIGDLVPNLNACSVIAVQKTVASIAVFHRKAAPALVTNSTYPSMHCDTILPLLPGPFEYYTAALLSDLFFKSHFS